MRRALAGFGKQMVEPVTSADARGVPDRVQLGDLRRASHGGRLEPHLLGTRRVEVIACTA